MSSVHKIPLVISCPACKQEGYHSPVEHWTHDGWCGGKLYLTEYAELYCGRCHQKAHALSCSFKCNTGRHGFRFVNNTAFASVVSSTGQMLNVGGIDWLIKVIQHIK